MKKIIIVFFIIFNINADDQHNIDSLIDGLHKDAHEGNFDSYFSRYSSDAIFLGTDKIERWTIEDLKLTPDQHLMMVMAGLIQLWSETGKGIATYAGLMKFSLMKS